MKKIFFGISMMLLSAAAFTASAQTQENAQSQKCDKQEQCEKVGKKADKGRKLCKGDSTLRRGDRNGKVVAFHGKHKGQHGKQFGRFEGNRGGRETLFSGIELNETQKAQIEALDQKMAAERKAMKEDTSKKTQEARAEAKKANAEAKKAYNTALKEILTAEQYTKYEANRDAMKLRAGANRDMKRIKADVRGAKTTEVVNAEAASK